LATLLALVGAILIFLTTETGLGAFVFLLGIAVEVIGALLGHKKR